MPSNDPRLQIAIDAAAERIGSALAAAARQVVERLGAQAQTAGRIAERDALNAALFELRRGGAALHRDFERALVERIAEDLSPEPAARRSLRSADWQSLTLVDDREVEDRMAGDRLGQQITKDGEELLRELDAHVGALLSKGGTAPERNPLRGEVLGAALHRAIAGVSKEADLQKLLTREFGHAMAAALRDAYRDILADLQSRGVQPLELSVRQVDGPGNQLPGLQSAYETLDSLPASTGVGGAGSHPRSAFPEASSAGSSYARGPMPAGTGFGGRDHAAGTPGTTGFATGRSPYPRADRASGSDAAQLEGARAGSASARDPRHPSDDELMALLRRWTAGGGGSGAPAFATTRRAAGDPAHDLHGSPPSGHDGTTEPGPSASGGPLSGLMAVNLIRAYRGELMKAAGGRLDPMVIDLVGSLFDQILSDARVPPQMARQIARLQLPVLRVALNDPSFFSSRRHPVRRFVDRIASLACAYDDFDDGPGQRFLERVRALVDEIVDGDFDQIGLYAAKVAALESFAEDQAQRDLQPGGTVATLGAKETELRLQQRYALQLRAALQPVAMAAFLRDFLAQVWSQALVVAAQTDGADSDRSKRYRRVGRDLVMSVQPQGSPALRKRFLMQLPGLMKDLDEGIALVGWPAAAQRELMGRLQPAHAASLKEPPLSELDHNLRAKQLEQIFAAPLPGQESLTPADAAAELPPETIARRFTPEEAERVGLVTETAVDWSRKVGTGVDIDLDLGAAATPNIADPAVVDTTDAAPRSTSGIDLDLDLDEPAAPPASDRGGASAPVERPARPPISGVSLMAHLKLGFAYQMHLKNHWQKVRLAHVSPGRAFFVFTCGRRHQETISMTARMLARMCETGRLRVVENRYLVDRATQRARLELRALEGARTTT